MFFLIFFLYFFSFAKVEEIIIEFQEIAENKFNNRKGNDGLHRLMVYYFLLFFILYFIFYFLFFIFIFINFFFLS